VIVQGGAYAEHQIGSVRPRPAEGAGAAPAAPVDVDGSHFAVRLAPGAGARFDVGMRRYANQPTLAFPWI